MDGAIAEASLLNDSFSIIALVGVFCLLAIVYLLHRTQRELIRKSTQVHVDMNARIANLEDQFLALPVTERRMSEAVRASIDPLNARLDNTDEKIAQIRDLVASVANKVLGD